MAVPVRGGNVVAVIERSAEVSPAATIVLADDHRFAVMSNFETALAFVSALTALGCDLALDDFGTGFGSFTYLKHLPARYLRIDMEFVRDVNEDPTDKEIVRSIVGIAHTLGKQTIAEGVETARVLKTLRQLGVDYAQGYHLGRPQPLPLPSVRNTRAAQQRPNGRRV
jgi:EAL domain-containing protein (putative c-di-GMP-specific phosphodiesterase class I)